MGTDFNLIQDILLPIAGAVIVCLLTVVMFFLQRVLRKVDDIGNALPAYQAKVDTMATQLGELKTDVSRINGDFKEVSQLRERVAVLEFASKQRKGLQ